MLHCSWNFRFITEQNRKQNLSFGTYMIVETDGQFAINTINELDSILESYSSVSKNLLKRREAGNQKGRIMDMSHMARVRDKKILLSGSSCGYYPYG